MHDDGALPGRKLIDPKGRQIDAYQRADKRFATTAADNQAGFTRLLGGQSTTASASPIERFVFEPNTEQCGEKYPPGGPGFVVFEPRGKTGWDQRSLANIHSRTASARSRMAFAFPGRPPICPKISMRRAVTASPVRSAPSRPVQAFKDRRPSLCAPAYRLGRAASVGSSAIVDRMPKWTRPSFSPSR